MSQQITDLGNGAGYIYVTEPGGTSSDIIKVFNNTKSGVRESKLYGVQGVSSALGRTAVGTITIDTVTGVGSITSITTSTGTNIIDPASAIAYTGATTTAQLASSVASAINSFEDLASPTENCTAVADSNVVYVYLSEDAGATLNGTNLIVTDTGNMTNTVGAFENGSGNSELYDEGFGYRFFLDADYNASGCTGLGTAVENSLSNAWEITRYIVPRHLNSAMQVEDATISSGVIYVERESSDLLVYIDTEGFVGADDLDSIRADGYANGDKITIRGTSGSRITTVKDGTGNIELEGGTDFNTGATEVALTLQLKDGIWYELSRTTAALGAMADYRAAGFGQFGVEEYNTAAVANTGTITFDGGVDDKYQKLTGSSTLIANTSYALGTGVNGDRFILEYDASVTVGGFSLSIFGITLTSDQALNGGLVFEAEYMEGAWHPRVYPNLNSGLSNPWSVSSADIGSGQVTLAKLESDLQKGFFSKEASFEANEQGIVDVEVPFDLTVNKVIASVSGDIAASNDAVLIMKDDAAVAMTNGTITIPAGTPVGNTYTASPTGNNTFTANQNIKFETIKSTAGGRITVTIHYTRD